jgi:hypothetical protein
MKIEFRKDIPVKYQLTSYRVLDGYPSKEDLLYDIINYCLNKIRRKNLKDEDFIIDVLDFSEVFRFDMNDEEFKQNIKILISELSNNELVKTNDGKLSVTKKGIKLFYNIID